MLTEEEYEAFEAAGDDQEAFLQRFVKLEKGEKIEKWEKESTVYGGDSDDELIKTGQAGQYYSLVIHLSLSFIYQI